MVLQQLSPEERAQAAGMVGADVKWVFSQKKVPMEWQVVLAFRGFGSIDGILGLGEDRAEVRATLKTGFGLDPVDSLETRLGVSTVLATWQAAQTFVKSEDQALVEARVAQITRPTDLIQHKAMRTAVEAELGGRKLDARHTPGRYYMGKKEEELDNGDLRAETLDKVVAVEDNDGETFTTTIGTDGNVKIKRSGTEGTLPKDPEELRVKFKIYGALFLMLKTKHANRSVLQDVTRGTWEDFVEYLLSEKVYRLELRAQGRRYGCSWPLLLSYELQMRKDAFEKVNLEGLGVDAAVRKAMKDPEIRQMYFASQLSAGERREIGGAGGGPPGPAAGGGPGRGLSIGGSDIAPTPGSAGGGGGAGGGGKGGGPKRQEPPPANPKPPKRRKIHFKTADGREICFKYNKKGGCSGACGGRVHACQYCLSDGHGMATGPEKAKNRR